MPYTFTQAPATTDKPKQATPRREKEGGKEVPSPATKARISKLANRFESQNAPADPTVGVKNAPKQQQQQQQQPQQPSSTVIPAKQAS